MSPQPKAPAPKVTLDQLDPEARRALLRELADEQEAIAAERKADRETEAETNAAARAKAVAALIDDRDHLRGCPGGRVEAYEARRPPRPSQGIPAADVTVARCIECGGSTVIEKAYAAVNAALDQAAEKILDGEDD